MLTKLTLRNFKRFQSAEIELGKAVVFIGPNNSGKTTALQALSLWEIGKRAWLAKRGDKDSSEKRPGVAINRRDLISIPVPVANLLWHERHTRDSMKTSGKPRTENVRVDVIVEGVTNGAFWNCGFEFDYSNDESFVCRPVRLPGHEHAPVGKARFSEIPKHARSVNVAYLPPMSGLSDREHLKQPGEVGFLIGQGRTAEVLRNLCRQVHSSDSAAWLEIKNTIRKLFGVELQPPEDVDERSEIVMRYQERGVTLDLSCAGRGLQQTLLLLTHLYANPQTILLLDEPDAHLEILRQRQIYNLLTETAESNGSQIISASHSEVVLNEAAGAGKVIAFVGGPHTMNERKSQVIKSLTDIGWDQYLQAETVGWILFLEGSTDLNILSAFAKTLSHPAAEVLTRPIFVHYVATNLPQRARDLFYGLREAKEDLAGIAIFDRIDKALQSNADLIEKMWKKRELENYLCSESVLMAYAHGAGEPDLFDDAERPSRERAMRESIDEMVAALRSLRKPDPWGPDIKASDEFLDPLFATYFEKLEQPITFRKSDYWHLASLVPKDAISFEVVEKLDAIVECAAKAKPRN
jgi:energy-coupling factor transporter ATP-binding protein EcfA2